MLCSVTKSSVSFNSNDCYFRFFDLLLLNDGWILCFMTEWPCYCETQWDLVYFLIIFVLKLTVTLRVWFSFFRGTWMEILKNFMNCRFCLNFFINGRGIYPMITCTWNYWLLLTGDELPVSEPSPLHTTTIVEKCTLKLVDDYKHMLCQATEPLSTFLEYIT